MYNELQSHTTMGFYYLLMAQFELSFNKTSFDVRKWMNNYSYHIPQREL